MVLPAVAIFIPHSSQRASFSLGLVKCLQRRLLFLRLGGTTKTAPDREPADATLSTLEDEVEEVSEEREVALKVLVEEVVCPEAIKKDQSKLSNKSLHNSRVSSTQLLADLRVFKYIININY